MFSLAGLPHIHLCWTEEWMWSSAAAEGEAEALAGAPAQRLREFGAGRHCARGLLRALGAPVAALLRLPDRRPAWPAGFVGSISHTSRRCLVAVARRSDHAALGVDIEPVTPLSDRVTRRIASTAESRWIARHSGCLRPLLARRLFCAKESVLKCHGELSSRTLSFRDHDLVFDDAGGAFRVAARAGSAAERLRDASGRFWIEDGHFAALFAAPPGPRRDGSAEPGD
jgi:4'-phosphopantetheinyl transferase EntD